MCSRTWIYCPCIPRRRHSSSTSVKIRNRKHKRGVSEKSPLEKNAIVCTMTWKTRKVSITHHLTFAIISALDACQALNHLGKATTDRYQSKMMEGRNRSWVRIKGRKGIQRSLITHVFARYPTHARKKIKPRLSHHSNHELERTLSCQPNTF